MKLSSVFKSILTLVVVVSSTHAIGSQVIQDDIKAISFDLKSEQIFTMKNYAKGEYKELAFTRIERPNLSVSLQRSDKKAAEVYQVDIDESALTLKKELLNIELKKNSIANIGIEKNQILAKLQSNKVMLSKVDTAKILKKAMVSNLNQIVSKIGFKDQTTLKYEIKSASLRCPELSGRILNCRAKYEISATIKNVKKKVSSNLIEILENSKGNFNTLGSEIEINTYISELRSINKKLNTLAESDSAKANLKQIYGIKKDVQSEILDSYQYTAVAGSSAVKFIDGLRQKVLN